MAFQNASTTTTTLAGLIKTYYDRVLLDALDPANRFYQFGVKKPLPLNEGTSIIWNRPVPLTLGFQLSQGTPVSTLNALSTQTVSAIISQYGAATGISDLSELTAITDVMTMAAQRLGQQAAITIDRVIQNQIINNVNVANVSTHSFGKTSASGLIEYWGQTSVTSDTVSSTNAVTVSDVRTAVYALKKLNVPAYEGNDYIAIINTAVAEGLVGDTTWINFHQYAAPGQENLYSGEIGKIYGCRFVETTNGPISIGSNSGGTASTLSYGMVVFGGGFYGVTELDGGIKTYIAQGATKSDPLNQVTTYGWKANFASKMLNPSCGLVYWVGAGTTTTAYAESAGSGTTYENPPAY